MLTARVPVVVDFLDSCRANTLLAELDDEEDLPEPDDDDDENEDDNQEDQEYEEVLVTTARRGGKTHGGGSVTGSDVTGVRPDRRRRSTRPKEDAGGRGTTTLS